MPPDYQSEIGNRKSAMLSLSSKSFDLYIHTRGQVELHQRIDRLWCRIENVHQTLVRPDLKLFARFLIDVRRAQDGPLVLDRRQRNRPGDARAGALRRVNDLCLRLVEDSVIVGFEPDSDFFVQHNRYARFQRASFLPELGCQAARWKRAYPGYSTTSETVPAPTVRPPSRIANRKPFSIAIGAINSISIATLSPGITISTPSGRCATPVTSVVRKSNYGRYPVQNRVCRPPSSFV